MKRFFLLILITPSLLFSQTKDELDLCMFIQANSLTSNAEAEYALDRILNVIGASKNFVISPCDKISNAVATAYKGTRYILYDREFMNQINKNTNDWSNLFIFAHEVGHHINGHPIDLLFLTSDVVDAPSLEKSRKQELEADEFAAFVLAKLGANLSQLNNVITLISDNSDDTYSTHPTRDKRLASVKTGFDKGYTQKSDKTVYVDSDDKKVFFDSNSKIKEYESSKGYVQYGKWFRKFEEDIFNGISWEAVSIGSVRGNDEIFKKAPILKISKDKSRKIEIKLEFENNLNNILNTNKLYDSAPIEITYIILNKNGNEIFRNNTDFFLRGTENSISEIIQSFQENPLEQLKKGSRVLFRLNSFNKDRGFSELMNLMRKNENETLPNKRAEESYLWLLERRAKQKYRNNIVQIKQDVYFEYSLSGSSKALAD